MSLFGVTWRVLNVIFSINFVSAERRTISELLTILLSALPASTFCVDISFSIDALKRGACRKISDENSIFISSLLFIGLAKSNNNRSPPA